MGKKAVNSPNTQVLIGDNEILYLGQTDQIIKEDVKYSGNVFPTSSSLETQEKLKQYTLQLSKEMQAQGYRGIAGFDWIEKEDGEVLFAETNPRKNRSSSVLFSILETINPGLSIANLEISAQKKESFNVSDLKLTEEGVFVKMITYKPNRPITALDLPEEKNSESEVFKQAIETGKTVTAILNKPVGKTSFGQTEPTIMRIVVAGKNQHEVEEAVKKSARNF